MSRKYEVTLIQVSLTCDLCVCLNATIHVKAKSWHFLRSFGNTSISPILSVPIFKAYHFRVLLLCLISYRQIINVSFDALCTRYLNYAKFENNLRLSKI